MIDLWVSIFNYKCFLVPKELHLHLSISSFSSSLIYTHKFRHIDTNVNTEPSFWSSWTDMLRTMWILHHYINGNGLFCHFNCTSQVHHLPLFSNFTCWVHFSFSFQFNWDAGKCPMQQFVNGGDSKMWALHKPPFC